MQQSAGPTGAKDAGKLKVFLSYSRKDSAFAQELLSALELLGFDAYLDREDIAPGEPWEERLGTLIRSADTVVFIITPNSIASKHCTWEVDETVRVAKRLVPVLLRPVPDGDVPERLRKLNYVFFTEGVSFSKGLGDLAKALRADANWIREHSRYGELAGRWNSRNKPEALLLRGSDLDDAQRWMAERPADAPEISAIQVAFVEASRTASAEALAAKLRLRWRVQAGLAVVAVAMAGLAGFAGLKYVEAERAKSSLIESNGKLTQAVGELAEARETLAKQNKLLAGVNARLERRLALRAGPLANQAYDVPAGWFQIATTYVGAVAFISSRSKPTEFVGSGVVVNGRKLDPRLPDTPVLVTATFLVGATGTTHATAFAPQDAAITLFGINNERHVLKLGRLLWEDERTAISISSLAGDLPPGLAPVDDLLESPAFFDNLPRLGQSDFPSLFDENLVLKDARATRPIVLVGNIAARTEMTLSISHLIARLGGPVDGSPRSGFANVPASPSVSDASDVLYTYVTMPGASGSPVFDAQTGKLIGIHLVGLPCRADVGQDRRCAGGAVSIPRIVMALKASSIAQ